MTPGTNEADGGEAQRGPPGQVRVAVVQLDYHPAFGDADQDALRDPLYRSDRETSSLLPEGSAGTVPPSLQKKYQALQERIRDAYVVQLRRRLERILDVCVRWKVQILVLPEYSVPAALLEPLAERGQDVVIVAGSHYVTSETLRRGIYERLGGPPRRDLLGQSVSPVLYRGRLLELVPKLHAARPEIGRMQPGQAWSAIDLPGDLPGPMGVMLCLDFLARRSAAHRELAAEGLERCRIIAAPSLTPTHSLEEFRAKALEDARRAHCPVLHANYAPEGGSTIYVDEGRPRELRLFPEHAGYLEPKEEGILVADVDLGMVRPGASTPYEVTAPMIPFAAASLVYEGTEKAYADWVRALEGVLEAPAQDDLERLDRVVEHVRAQPPPMPEGESARRRRLTRLLQVIEQVSDVERVRRLTREVVLAEDVLPLHAVRAALARGTADVIGRWVSEEGAGEFGPVEVRQREAWITVEKKEMGSWTAVARRVAEEVREAVRGGPAPQPREALMQALVATEQEKAELLQALAAFEAEVARRLQEDQKRAGDLLEEGRCEEAREEWRKILVTAESLRSQGAGAARQSARTWAAASQLEVAMHTLTLQEMENAKEMLMGIDPEALSMEGRIRLAGGLALVGERVRALDLVPDKDVLNDKHQEMLAELRQILALLDGELPTELLPSAALHAWAAALLFARNDLSGAADHLLKSLKIGHRYPGNTADVLMLLTEALERTVYELPPSARFIPVEEHAAIVKELDTRLADLRNRQLPSAIEKKVTFIEAFFQNLTEDNEQLLNVEKAHDYQEHGEAPLGTAFALARQGRADEALRALPPDDHPWRSRALRVRILTVAEQPERALAEAIELAVAAPGRAPVEYLTALLLMHAGRAEEALPHAQSSFDALPGRGQRLLLAETRLALGDATEAWDLLQPATRRKSPRLLRALINAAWATQRGGEAIEATREYLALRPADGRARVQLAQLLNWQHRPTEAAEEAWRAFQEHGDQLDQEALYHCGRLQRLGRLPGAEQEHRVKTVAERLNARFPGDPETEPLRLQLLLSLGELPKDAAPIDFERLAQEGNFHRGTSLDELRELFEQRRRRLDAIAQMARWGAIPIETTCALSGTPAAMLITRILRAGRQATGAICPPVGIADVPPALDLRGARLLVSDLEILLLEKLDLFRLLRDALGKEGRLLLFAHVDTRIRQDAAELEASAHPDKLRKQDAWLRRIERFRIADADPAARLDDCAAARRAGAALIDNAAPTDVVRLSPRGIVERLFKVRGISDEQHEQILPYCTEDPEPLPEPLPAKIVVGNALLQPLLEADALDALRELIGGEVLLGPWAVALLRHERDKLADDIDAHALADAAAHRTVEGIGNNDGWIRVEPDRPAADVPSLREPSDDWDRALALEPAQTTDAYYALMLERPEIWRLTADFYGSHMPFVAAFMRLLVWPSREAYVGWVEGVQKASARDLTLPALTRLLVQDERALDQRLRQLASLGFPDALGPKELLRLERRYRGLDRGEPARILDRQEWMAREPGHLGGAEARVRLTAAYSGAIFLAFSEEQDAHVGPRPTIERDALLQVLLSRQEAIGRATRTNTLDQSLLLLAVATMQNVRSAWKLVEDAYVPDPEGAAATLWKSVAAWTGDDGSRRAAYGRALREAWRVLDERTGGDSRVHAITLEMVHRGTPVRSGGIWLVDPELEAQAILSACWSERPLRSEGVEIRRSPNEPPYSVDCERLLAEGGAWLAANPDVLESSRAIQVLMPIPGREGTIPVRAPVEAFFLRAPAEARSSIATRLKQLQGVHDGELYRLLTDIERSPDDAQKLRAYARRASGALFRLVRDDPAFLHLWPQSPHFGEGGHRLGIDDLRRILSEPDGPLPGVREAPLAMLIEKRLHEGCWSTRVDRGRLLAAATEVPGALPAHTVRPRTDDEDHYDRHVEAALHRLDTNEEHPIARIAGDVMFLRVAAAWRPNVQLPEGEVNLREALPGRLARLLAQVAAPPAPDTMADCEAALLRVTRGAVERLAAPARLPMRDDLWLTYRLFQWLCLQLEALPPDTRRDGMRRLVAGAPPPVPVEDLLDPFGFGRDRFDHRLATILLALESMEGLARGLSGEDAEKQKAVRAWSPSSPELEAQLLLIAERPAPGPALTSQLDWNGPGSVPDLALMALLRLALEAFANLSPESQRRRIEALPIDPDRLEGSAGELAWLVMVAAADHAARLGSEERALLEERARAMTDGPTGRLWRCMILVALFSSGGTHLEPEARALVLDHVAHEMAPTLLGRFLLGVAARDPAEIEPMAEAMLDAGLDRGADMVGLLLGSLGRVAVHGALPAKEAALGLLARVAERAPFKDDARMAQVARFFGLGGGQG